MTGKQRRAWEALASAAASAAPIFEPGRDAPHAVAERLSERLIDAELSRAGCGRKSIAAVVNDERSMPSSQGVLAGLTVDEVADAMRAGWPELGLEEARINAEGYIDRRGDPDRG